MLVGSVLLMPKRMARRRAGGFWVSRCAVALAGQGQRSLVFIQGGRMGRAHGKYRFR